MSDPFLSALVESNEATTRPTAESALRLLVADIRSLGEPPAQLLVALAKADEVLGGDAEIPEEPSAAGIEDMNECLAFDPKCLDLAEYFLPDIADGPKLASYLAQEIQDAVEGWIDGERQLRAEAKAERGCRRLEPGCDWPNCPCGSEP